MITVFRLILFPMNLTRPMIYHPLPTPRHRHRHLHRHHRPHHLRGPSNILSNEALDGIPFIRASTRIGSTDESDDIIITKQLKKMAAADSKQQQHTASSSADVSAAVPNRESNAPLRNAFRLFVNAAVFRVICDGLKTRDLLISNEQNRKIKCGDRIDYHNDESISAVSTNAVSITHYRTLQAFVDEQSQALSHYLPYVSIDGVMAYYQSAWNADELKQSDGFLSIQFDSVRTIMMEGKYHVKPSTDMAWDNDPRWFEKAFPHLVPFGRGLFDEPRSIRISRSSLLRHLLSLSHGRFQCWDFVLTAYDIISRESCSTAAYLRTKFRFNTTESAAQQSMFFKKLNSADVAKAAAFVEARNHALRRGGCAPPIPPSIASNRQLMDFINDITVCTREAKHSLTRLIQAKLEMFSLHYFFGKPTWWYAQIPSFALFISLCPLCNDWMTG